MNEKIRIEDLPELDFSEHLDNEIAISEYLTIILEENDPALLKVALGDIARARGMNDMAKDAGLTSKALYQALRPSKTPQLDIINRVCLALGANPAAQQT